MAELAQRQLPIVLEAVTGALKIQGQFQQFSKTLSQDKNFKSACGGMEWLVNVFEGLGLIPQYNKK